METIIANINAQLETLTEDLMVVDYDYNCDCVIFTANNGYTAWVGEDLSETEMVNEAVEQLTNY